jgi:hypothetical protein
MQRRQCIVLRVPHWSELIQGMIDTYEPNILFSVCTVKQIYIREALMTLSLTIALLYWHTELNWSQTGIFRDSHYLALISPGDNYA